VSQKGYDLLGLAQRAGKVQSGDAAAEAVIKKGKVKLVLLAVDASDRTKEHFTNLCRFKKIRWIESGEKERLGNALGKSPRSIVVVTDEGFARRLIQLFGGVEEDF